MIEAIKGDKRKRPAQVLRGALVGFEDETTLPARHRSKLRMPCHRPALSSPQSQHVRRCVPRGLTARLASPLPTHLLRICAGALYRRAQCAISKFASGKKPTGLFARKHLLAPYTGEARGGWLPGNYSLRLIIGVRRVMSHLPEEEAKIRIKQPLRHGTEASFGCRATVSRGRARARSGNAPNNGAFPSSQMAKSPPGSLQESICSPLHRGG